MPVSFLANPAEPCQLSKGTEGFPVRCVAEDGRGASSACAWWVGLLFAGLKPGIASALHHFPQKSRVNKAVSYCLVEFGGSYSTLLSFLFYLFLIIYRRLLHSIISMIAL